MIYFLDSSSKAENLTSRALIAIAVLIPLWAWQAWHIWSAIYAGGAMAFADSGVPMLLSADGYYYLERANAALCSESLKGIPLISALTAIAHHVTGLSTEGLALLWGPCALIPLALLCAALTRRLAAPVYTAGLTALVLALMPAWTERTHFGWFDTDAVIALLWHASFLSAAAWGDAESRSVNGLKYGLQSLLCCLLLAWWWRPGIISLPLCLLLWAASGKNGTWRSVRRWIGLALLAGLCVLALAPDTWLPSFLYELRSYAVAHARLVLGLHDELIYRAIDELGAHSPDAVLTALGGGVMGGLVALFALVLLCATRPRACLFLLPSMGMLLLGLWADRFLFLAAPMLACAVALLPSLLLDSLGRLRSAWQGRKSQTTKKAKGRAQAREGRQPAPLLQLAAFILPCAVIANMFLWQKDWQPRALFNRSLDSMALSLRKAAGATPHEAVALWNWWDDGYFLAARTGLRPLFHGGSQSPLMAYIAARPLTSDNDTLARRWMRFFALRGEAGLAPLRAAWGDAVWKNLEAILSADDPKAALAGLPPVAVPGAGVGIRPGAGQASDKQQDAAYAWLFPQGRVFLYLPQNFLDIAEYWIPMGTRLGAREKTSGLNIDSFERERFLYDPARQEVVLPQKLLDKGYKDFGGVFVTSALPLPQPYPADGPFVVTSLSSPYLYVVDDTALKSLAFRLLAPAYPAGDRTLAEKGITTLAFDPAVGGVWEMLP